MRVDPKARKPCEWCGRTMRPRYNPDRGDYESQHWERAGAWSKRRFCSRRCQNFVMAQRRVYVVIHTKRDDEILRLKGLGLTIGQIAAQVGTKPSTVMGALQRRRDRASGKRVTLREMAEREQAAREAEKAALAVKERRRAWRKRRARKEAARKKAAGTATEGDRGRSG